ncbi:hypothetical protein EDD85DRAFT_796518 [Armillaria nabsnona]|nr:hypothetical protein EDD85DRAFT_796518 [Armillaria nabsnona]
MLLVRSLANASFFSLTSLFFTAALETSVTGKHRLATSRCTLMGANGCVGFLAAQDVGSITLPDAACKAAGVMESSPSKSGFGEHWGRGDGLTFAGEWLVRETGLAEKLGEHVSTTNRTVLVFVASAKGILSCVGVVNGGHLLQQGSGR